MEPTAKTKHVASSYRWTAPEPKPRRELKLLNSFTKRKEVFVANESKLVKWYTCGPTVYDVSHLGHARCYITFDIIRRILTDYFGLQVLYVMNITDIDDKIIKRALGDKPNGSPDTDHQIFKALTLKFEQEFHEDMHSLNVLRPSVLTRVTGNIDRIGAYLKRLEENGFAYRSNGSVYFDTNKFDADQKHSYAKLVRQAFGQKERLDEGEGELTQQDEKRSPNDFALWKKSKVGEPSWKIEDYDEGRPGWHIECSVMASHLLGENFDIHSGGCDLKFPHHDNEIAQAEAYYNTGKDWVNYFIHSGHLTISGCKMSKSLKNFITIRDALKKYSSRQLRFAFLAHGWADTLDYSDNTMNTAISYEKAFKRFFLDVTNDLRLRKGDKKLCDLFEEWSASDQQLNQKFINIVDKVDAALCDNFDTRTVMNQLRALIKECNKRTDVNLVLIEDIACYVTRILTIFGARFDEFEFGIPSEIRAKFNENESIVKCRKSVETIVKLRADLRKIAKTGGDSEQSQQLMALCDNLRDKILPELGILLDDKNE